MSKLNDLSESAITRIKSISFYRKIGQLDENSEVTAIRSFDLAVKLSESVEWMNTRLDWCNQLTRQLSARNRIEYREWNNIVDEAESKLEQCWICPVPETSQLERVFKNVKLDALYYIMECHFSAKVDVRHFERLIPWYELGHIPCGWEGKFPSGKLVIY